jgi:thiol-disulfide isomerase/thioredoxin
MKRTLSIILLTLLVAVVTATGGPVTVLNGGETLATHRLTSLDGKTTTLAAYRGDVVVVNFWASWCAPCRRELPLLDQWNKEWQGRGARVIAISIDKDVRKAKKFLDEMELSLPVMHDGPDGLARTLDIPAVPYTLLLDREGNVIQTVSGSTEGEVAALGRKVETMIATREARPVQEAGMTGDSR